MINANATRMIVLHLLFLLVATTNAAAADEEEAAALLRFKSHLIDELGHLNDWRTDDTDSAPSSACTWTGVQCDESGSVAALNLGNRNLSGTLSAIDLAALPNLANVSLQQNNLSGALPAELAAVHSLRRLNISHNNFGYTFPPNISNLEHLEVLDCYNNNFSGPIPPELGAFNSMVHLHLGGSYFSGVIPPEIGSMTTLKYLALSGNSLVGIIPPELGLLENLEEIYLGYYNAFEGGIPVEFGNLRSLVRIDLGFCGLTGTIPAELGRLYRLDSMFLQINNLTGPIPRELGGLGQLKSLDLSNNRLTGGIPDDFAMLEQLRLVNLFRNELDGPVPSFFGDLPNLNVLNLWANRFSGPIPPQLGAAAPSLSYVDLSTNRLTGPIPAGICSGRSLQVLILYGNELDGAVPAALGACESLVRVRLGSNRFTGGIPDGFLALPRLQMLELPDNRLDGTIPAGPIAASVLQSLDLSSNSLHGPIPAAIGNLSSLQTLHLEDNRLSGSIPASIGELKQLLAFWASRNSIGGAIPPAIGGCIRLSNIDLSMNQLVGTIPAEMEHLGTLDALNLSRNLLSGRIPPSLDKIASLTAIDVSDNQLFGPIPWAGHFKYLNASAFEGNPGLCGAPLARLCSAAKDQPRPSGGGGPAAPLYGWLIGATFAAALLIAVIGTAVFVRRYRERYPGVGAGRCCLTALLDGRRRKKRRPWRLTAFTKLEFAAVDVVDCLTEDNVIGRGGSGTVYRGMMPSGDIVAVKRLSSTPPSASTRRSGSSHDDYGFSAEIQTLGKIRHMNIVRLLGFCSNHETNLLVYEYMPNGSLGEMIHGAGKKGGSPLDWDTRYKIAVQAANGLCYLHHDCSPLIVHRDVKSNNILLDSNMRAHVADFGLAKLVQGSGKSESMSSIAGSYGYIAPEYAYTLKVNEKSDIYSFGVVLLELVTGRRPIESEYGDGVDIVQWVRKKIQTRDGVLDILDSKMGGSDLLPLHEAMLVLRVALLCSSDSPTERPTMRDVVQMLADVKPSKVSISSKDFGSNRVVPAFVSSENLIDV